MDELKNSIVHKNLDMKIKLIGIELVDLLLVLFFSAFMNLFFRGTSISWLMVFVLPLILGIILHFGKKNKPESFIKHFARFYFLPGVLAAGKKANRRNKISPFGLGN
ncbi:MAG: hypothetical protein HQK51_20195, partial [Oligoflexia bacterium]|nr:hypothetical protein [Oligoflexia bacterium]